MSYCRSRKSFTAYGPYKAHSSYPYRSHYSSYRRGRVSATRGKKKSTVSMKQIEYQVAKAMKKGPLRLEEPTVLQCASLFLPVFSSEQYAEHNYLRIPVTDAIMGERVGHDPPDHRQHTTKEVYIKDVGIKFNVIYVRSGQLMAICYPARVQGRTGLKEESVDMKGLDATEESGYFMAGVKTGEKGSDCRLLDVAETGMVSEEGPFAVRSGARGLEMDSVDGSLFNCSLSKHGGKPRGTVTGRKNHRPFGRSRRFFEAELNCNSVLAVGGVMGAQTAYIEVFFELNKTVKFKSEAGNELVWEDPIETLMGVRHPVKDDIRIAQQISNNSLMTLPSVETHKPWVDMFDLPTVSLRLAPKVSFTELDRDILPPCHEPGMQSTSYPSPNVECVSSNLANAIEPTENNQVPIMPSEYIDPTDSGSSFSEYETYLEDDEMRESIQDMDFRSIYSTNGDLRTSSCRYMISKVLSPTQKALVDRMMTGFWVIFKQEADFIPRYFTIDITPQGQCDETLDSGDEPRGSRTQQSCSALETRSSSQQTTFNPGSKRMNVEQDSQDDRNDDDRDLKRPKIPPSLPQGADERAKFACPYRKHNPAQYNVNVRKWRSCALTGFGTVARVKGHLDRHHLIFSCPRCKTEFKNQEQVNQHLREQEPCVLQEIGYSEGDGLTSDIVERLKSKKKSEKNQSDGDKWKEIYRLLFPHEIVPNPYFEAVQENLSQWPYSRELANCEEFCRHAFPRLLRPALEEIIPNESHPILAPIIRDCQDKVFSEYRESTATNAISPVRTHTHPTKPGVACPLLSADNILLDRELVDDTRTSHSVPSFLQPPPAQNHLRSHELNSTALESNPGKPMSDSGYASNSSDLSQYLTSHNAQCSSRTTFEPAPATAPEPEQQQYFDPVLEPPPHTEPALAQPPLTKQIPEVGSFQFPSGGYDEEFNSTISSDITFSFENMVDFNDPHLEQGRQEWW